MFSRQISIFRLHLQLTALIATSLALNANLAQAAEASGEDGVAEVVITATIASRDILGDLRGVSRSEITPLSLETQQIRIVSDILRGVPGIASAAPELSAILPRFVFAAARAIIPWC